MKNFDQNLLLQDFVIEHYLGVSDFNELRELLSNIDPEEAASSTLKTSKFAKELKNLNLHEDVLKNLRDYDTNIKEYEEKVSQNRDITITWKYYQWLSLFLTEIYLDHYFKDKEQFFETFKKHVKEHNKDKDEGVYSPKEKNLGKIAYWMATGSGKTLLMHANFFQYKKYAEKYNKQNHIENILLITPNEGLTTQHIDEFNQSGIQAKPFSIRTSQDPKTDITVIDIHKIREEGKDKTVGVDLFEGNNIVFVDEGHKGVQGNTWVKHREEIIGRNGFSFEYSATFGQALNNIDNEKIQNRYLQSILFEYSFKYFTEDGYGKDYNILNLKDTTKKIRQEYFVANLLAFYEQKKYYKDKEAYLKEFNLENPLWIFVGQTVTAYNRSRDKKTKASDVEQVLISLNTFLQEKDKAIKQIEQTLEGDTFLDEQDRPLFKDQFKYLKETNLTPKQLYQDAIKTVFNASANQTLTVVELKNADGEIGLRVGSSPYFGLVSIGATKKFLEKIGRHDIKQEEQEFKQSLFQTLDNKNSPINILVGAKKFVEGWDNFRVSNMGLLNVGKGEGSEIIQIFGRGVRLKGKNYSLKRSKELLLSEEERPEHIEILETLNVFGVRADYIEQFKEKLDDEDIPTKTKIKKTIQTQPNKKLLRAGLKLPKKNIKENFYETVITFDSDSIQQNQITIDLYPTTEKVSSIDKNTSKTNKNYIHKEDLLQYGIDWDKITLQLRQYKQQRKYYNLIIKKQELKNIVLQEKFNLRAPETALEEDIIQGRKTRHKLITEILRKAITTYYNKEKSDWEDKQREYQEITPKDELVNYTLILQVPDEKEALREVEEQLNKIQRGKETDWTIDFDRSLYTPLFIKQQLKQHKYGDEYIDPPKDALNEDERSLVESLKELTETKKLDKKDVYLLRNPVRKGLGFAEGGYPDFILWIITKQQQNILLLEPHGMVFEDDDIQNVPKVKLSKRVKNLQHRLKGNVKLSSYLISTTNRENLRRSLTSEQRRENNVYLSERGYLEKILDKEGLISK